MIEVVIAQNVKGHRLRGVCIPVADKRHACTITVPRRTLTFSASAGSNTFKLKLAGPSRGSCSATVTARDANGTSQRVKLTFTITNR